MAVPFDQGYVCLNVDTQALEENNVSYPTTLEELVNEDGKVEPHSRVQQRPRPDVPS